MLPLLQAIYAAFTGSLAGTFRGGLHRDQAPENTAMPYVVSQVISAKTQYAFSGPYRTAAQVRFAAYGVGHDATATAAQALVAAFDDATLALSSGTCDSVTRLGDLVGKLHRHDAMGNDVWEWAVVYEFGVLL
ncbi:MAG TPA: DUF3168 domain-containing protein [Tepidisphaeraceae bacterium]|jgi:hypothetical protein|nr:DUF3168 domain-containing protein [Tepidisphaeraceae bacterium]